jgi:hypothetical protein
MKALFAQATLYSSSRILPQAVAKSPSRPWQSRWAAAARQNHNSNNPEVTVDIAVDVSKHVDFFCPKGAHPSSPILPTAALSALA